MLWNIQKNHNINNKYQHIPVFKEYDDYFIFIEKVLIFLILLFMEMSAGLLAWHSKRNKFLPFQQLRGSKTQCSSCSFRVKILSEQLWESLTVKQPWQVKVSTKVIPTINEAIFKINIISVFVGTLKNQKQPPEVFYKKNCS